MFLAEVRCVYPPLRSCETHPDPDRARTWLVARATEAVYDRAGDDPDFGREFSRLHLDATVGLRGTITRIADRRVVARFRNFGVTIEEY